ncbi:MaoC family dehydratase [Carboxylicivirga sp. A043]|uniref:MaoC family dehydratase n=1 Tax=Carboxylicivirga litoralis TaxID=2816963 RepID=UPI0021CAF762|nr:MaoC family dehydratase [Carboxylicivirga sp. A043]MCU4156687.1 MaoC family dehydratase [Carboxylicivirga sp. A043]
MEVINSDFGRYLEDFKQDTIIKHWPGKTITESDNNLFSLLTMNHHPVHLDQYYAGQQQHGQVLVVGTLVFSLVVGLTVRDISGKAIANLNYSEINHHGPVHIGDTLYAETEILSVRESKSKTDRGIVKVTTKAYNQKEEMVLSFSREVLVKKRPINE